MSIVKNKALSHHSLDGVIGAQNSGKKIAGNAFRASLLMATILVAGCSSFNKDHVIVGSVPSDYRTKHPIVVSDNEVFEDIALSANTRVLSLRDRNVVRNFARNFKRSGARSVRIVIPVGSRNERAARKILSQIVAEFQNNNVPSNRIVKSGYQASGHGDAASIRLVFNSMTAQVASECGVWDGDLARSPENRNYGNFGCATQNNLAALVSNPADLLGPRGQSEIDAKRRGKVIENWQAGKSTASETVLPAGL